MSSLPARMIQSKMKELEWSQHFSHYKSMVFPNAQRQLPPQLLVRSGQISNAFETSSAKKKIRSKMKALECSQQYVDFCRHSRADNSGVRGGIWPKFELIQVFTYILITCKNEDDSIKNEGARVVTTFFPL